MAIDLAAATGRPLVLVRRQAAESLVVLHHLGELLFTALRQATLDGDLTRLAPLIDGPVTALINQTAAITREIAWGNVASVVASSARLIGEEDPTLATRATAVAGEVLALAVLSTAWTGTVGSTFRRTTCCQVTDAAEARCGDCVRGSQAQ